MRLAVYSRGIWRINGLAAFLPEYEMVYKSPADAVAGWGIKHTTRRAMVVARKNKIPYMALEDGFLRSYGLGVQRSAPFSLVVDDLGIYYDATKTSRLEQLISADHLSELERAKSAMAEIKTRQLSKYNNFTQKWNLPKGKYVLAVDQCAGDYSIKYGLADESSFKAMLEKARDENPGAKVIIKIHPDVMAGKRAGYLKDLAWKDDVILTDNINPHIIFDNVEKIYTVSSLIGMDALIHGKEVRCFGMPFYAGWGATHDELKSIRRTSKRSAEEIFAAAYIKYSRYVDPYMKTPSTIENAIDGLSFVKNYYEGHTRNYYCIGFSSWKRSFIKPYIKSPANKVKFFSSQESAIEEAKKDADPALLVWASREEKTLAAEAGKLPLYRMEDGFIRSAGLGSDLIPANSLIIDKSGIYFDQSRESDIENILNAGNFAAEKIKRAGDILNKINTAGISKYNLNENASLPEFPAGKKKLLVIGQVEDDASIKRGALDIKTNAQLLEAVKKDNPDAYIIYRPHPDVTSGNREGAADEKGADVIIKDVPIHMLISKADEVHTITSLAGFEAILQDKKVVCYGVPFYHGWGLTSGVKAPARRKRTVNKLELLAASVIDYPAYFDFSVNLPCSAEVIVTKLAEKKIRPHQRHKLTKVFNWICLNLKN